MCMTCLEGDRTKAEHINSKLEILNEKLFLESNPIPVKWCLSEMKLFPTGIRLPMTHLSEIYHDELREALNKAGILN